MARLAFSTDVLPAGLRGHARLDAWYAHREHRMAALGARIGRLTVEPAGEAPFEVHTLGLRVDRTRLASWRSTAGRFARSASEAVREGIDDFHLILHRGPGSLRITQEARVCELPPGGATLCDQSMAFAVESRAATSRLTVALPRGLLEEVTRRPRELLLQPLDPASEAVRLLQVLARGVLEEGSVESTAVRATLDRSLIDLVALAVRAADREPERAIASVREARRVGLERDIRDHFTDPDFNVATLAARQRLSVRYVQELLAEAGGTLADRLTAERLEHARRILLAPEGAGRKVLDIALSSGFSDLSYFNRTFRRRFGMTPRDVRALGAQRREQG